MKKRYGLNIRVTQETRDRLAEIAKATGASKTDVVTTLIDTAYTNLEKQREHNADGASRTIPAAAAG